MSQAKNSEFGSVSLPSTERPADLRRKLDEAIEAINRLGMGHIGSIIEVTLEASQATTTVTHPAIGYTSTFLWDPLTANAQSELTGTGVPLAAKTARLIGSATFTHANSAQSDRTFRVTILG